MDKFTASNGARVTVDGERVDVVAPVGADPFEPVEGAVTALREFFQHERDQELGRWRWPENPDYVVYPVAADTVDVLRESSASDKFRGPGREQSIARSAAASWENPAAQHFYAAARAYFAAHPEPKPWHDAKPGEVWVLNTDTEGDGHAWMVDPDYGGGRFVFIGGLSNIPLDHPDISAGRRIWPEVPDEA